MNNVKINNNKYYNIVENYMDYFGSSYWHILHLESFKIYLMTLNGVDDQLIKKKKEDFFLFFKYIIDSLMCSCKNHALRLLIKNKYNIDENLFLYLINFHNTINERLNKPIMSYNSVIEYYLNFVEKINLN